MANTLAGPLQTAQFEAVDGAMALAEFDCDGRLLHANDHYLKLLQLENVPWVGRSHASFCPEALSERTVCDKVWQRLLSDKAFAGVVEHVREDGSICWMQAVYTLVHDAQGQLTRVLKAALDITQQHTQALLLKNHLQRLSLVAEVTDAAVLISDAQPRIVYVNGGFSRMFGWSLEDISDRDIFELLTPEKHTQFRDDSRAGRAAEHEEIMAGKSGKRYWCKAQSNPVMDDNGELLFVISVITDITNSKIHEVLQHRVLEAMARDRPLIEVLSIVCEEVERIAPEVSASILAVDAQGLLRPLVSPRLPSTYSQQLDGIAIGPSVGSCGTAAWRKEAVLVSDIATDPLWADYKDLILPFGYKACWSTPILDQAGNVFGTFAFYFREAGQLVASNYYRQLVNACTHLCALAMEREQSRQRIRQLAFYDALTGLPNHSLLEAKAEKALIAAAGANHQVAVLCIDLDRFKHVNDSLGHPAGDGVLSTVAARIREVLQHTDFAGRLSGDEFVVVLTECDLEHVNVVIERMQNLLTQPLKLEDNWVRVSASIGVSIFPQDGRNVETLLQRAGMALHQAKMAGRGRFSFFSSEMNQVAQERLVLENALREALHDGALHLHYQPQVKLDSGQLYGVEALARWTHPKFGQVSPARFISLAEECGLIADLGHWALKEACRQLAQWRAQGLNVPCVAVNLSSSNFHHLELTGLIEQMLQQHGLEPKDLTLELTESILLDSNVNTMKTIEQIHAKGMRLSMDDFGTGYSSLSYLRRLPVGELKLDRSFVANLEDDEAASALSAAILGIGKSLHLTVVAEGVETARQTDMLREQGYHVGQGYLFAPPLAPQDFEQWLRARSG